MFKKWPEFYSDFPMYNRFPMHVTSGAGAALKMPNFRTKSLPAPEAEPRRPVHRSSIAATEIAPEDEGPSSTSAPFDTIPPLAHPSSNPFSANVSASNGFYSVQAFDDWWGAPMQFAQQQASQQAGQQQQGREMGGFQSQMASRADHLGLYGLSF